MRVTGVPGMPGSGLLGRLKIGICLFALCWPLLATAAPVLASPTVPACCRRHGAHHCGMPVPQEFTVSAVCPYSSHHLKFAGSKSAQPAPLILLTRSLSARRLVVAPFAAAPHSQSIALSSRAPPRA